MSLRTFVVEDDADVRRAVVELLGNGLGCRIVGHAETESAAVLWLLSNPNDWDLVVVDLLLTSGNGLRVLAACRVRNPTQKMVVLTAHASGEMRRRCLDLGADAVFDKSTETDALHAYCALQLRNHQARTARAEAETEAMVFSVN
jgi:DNA-binding NarL/FixJ family response regulator